MSKEDERRVFAVVGDVVGSRNLEPATMRRGLRDATAYANHVVGPASANDDVREWQPLTESVGDEVQAVVLTLEAALLMTWAAQVRAAPAFGLRFGIGVGTIHLSDRSTSPPLQEGSAWWSARAAVDHVAARARTRAAPYCRTALIASENALAAETASAVQAYLLLRDSILSSLDARESRVLLKLMVGQRQQGIAYDEGINQSSVSRTARRSHLTALVEGARVLARSVGAPDPDAAGWDRERLG